MANDKRFLTKNGLQAPNISFSSSNSAFANSITATFLDTLGTLSFSGQSGQLFSIVDSLTGTIFSVNDISGIPSIEVFDVGNIRLAEFSGNVAIGSANTSSARLFIQGNTLANGNITLTGGIIANGSIGTAGQALISNGSVAYWSNNPGYTGSTGFTGSVGAQGPIGFTGSIGAQGPQGTTGFTGSIGFTGSQGPIGFTGSRGATGFTGSNGFTGSQGETGVEISNTAPVATDVLWVDTSVLGAEGTFVNLNGTQTLTNKRINPRVVSAGVTSGNITPNGDTTDVLNAFGLTGAITLLTPSGTPVDGQRLILRFEDNGTGRGITWTTSSGAFRAVGVTLPTTTVATKITYVGCIYNTTDVFWDVIAVTTQA